jgi:hypothetical protein
LSNIGDSFKSPLFPEDSLSGYKPLKSKEMKTYPRLFQLLNCDNEPAGLYIADVSVEEMNDDEIVEAIENAYANNRDSEEVIEDAEKELEQLNIYRVFAVEANTDVI